MKSLLSALLLFLFLTAVTGIVYPLLITGIAQTAFPRQANGSLIVVDGKTRGSRLIGQAFDDPRYFWGRPSATTPPNNAAASSGSNLGPANPALQEAISARIKALRDADPGNREPIPTDLVTASASGLDPHISPEAAEYQVRRVARARRLPEAWVRERVKEHTQGPQLGILGEPIVNVLELNLSLDTEKGP